jgi:hypothetical protein
MKRACSGSILFVLFFCFNCLHVTSAPSKAIQKPEKKLIGKLSRGEYAFPGGKLRIKIPFLIEPGAKIRDEKADDVTQVILTDDFGAFYRVVALDNSRGEYELDAVLNVFKDIREKEIITTNRGKELRVVDLEKEGAELILTNITKDSEGRTRIEQRAPDLLTANAAFEWDHLIIHVAAGLSVGLSVINPGKEETKVALVKERLDKFLSGIVLPESKR